MNLLTGEFGEHFISRSGPPISWDLTPLDYFLWGYIKAHVSGKSDSIDALEASVDAFIREVPFEMLERVCQNCTKRMDICINKS